MRLFTHFLNQTVINSWLVYVNCVGGTKPLVEFMLSLCLSLMAGGEHQFLLMMLMLLHLNRNKNGLDH